MMDRTQLDGWKDWIDAFVVNDIRKSLEADTLEVSLIILCLVGIETLSGYFTGKAMTSQETFRQFMESYFPGTYQPYLDSIYEKLRNGLVHSYIVNKSDGDGEPPFIMSRNSHENHLVKHGNGQTWINREIFARDFIEAWEAYANDVYKDVDLQANVNTRIQAIGYLKVIDIPSSALKSEERTNEHNAPTIKRKLASLQRVVSIRPIENADRIDQATVMGWNVVVKKGEFQPGDLCVFFEIDSLLPETEWSEFMRPLKFRVKTARLRGVLSQGLALTLAILPENQCDALGEGDDVTSLLGVTKYEPPQPTDMGDSAGPFPGYVPKTDEMRIQSALLLLDELRGRPYYVTIKCDGTSFTSVYDGEKLLVCSRGNVKRESDTDIYWRAARALGLPEKLQAHPRMAVQGELCGPGIQKNRLGLKDKQVFMFSVFDVQAGKYLDYADFMHFCDELSLPTVPLHSTGEAFDFTLDDLLELARGKYDGTGSNREGIVIRPMQETFSQTLNGRLSFKVLNNDFLLKDEE